MKGRLITCLTAVVMFAAVLTLTACESGSEPLPGEGTAAPTPTVPTPSVRPTDSDVDGLQDFDSFRNFTQQLQAALDAGNTSFFASRIEETRVTCTGTAEPRGACANLPAGTILRGLPSNISGADALQIIAPADYASGMQTWLASARPDLSDQFGKGAAALYAVGKMDTSDKAGSYFAVLSAIYSGRESAERQALVLQFQFKDGSWRLQAEERAVNPGTPEPWLLGDCATCYDEWEQWTDSAG